MKVKRKNVCYRNVSNAKKLMEKELKRKASTIRRILLTNLNHEDYLLQDGLSHVEKRKKYLIAININSYSPLRERWDLLSEHSRVQTQFDKIRKVEGY